MKPKPMPDFLDKETEDIINTLFRDMKIKNYSNKEKIKAVYNYKKYLMPEFTYFEILVKLEVSSGCFKHEYAKLSDKTYAIERREVLSKIFDDLLTKGCYPTDIAERYKISKETVTSHATVNSNQRGSKKWTSKEEEVIIDRHKYYYQYMKTDMDFCKAVQDTLDDRSLHSILWKFKNLKQRGIIR